MCGTGVLVTRAELAFAAQLRGEGWLVLDGGSVLSRCPLCGYSLVVAAGPVDAAPRVCCLGGCASALVMLAWLGVLGRRGRWMGVDTARCGSCDAPIRWGLTVDGKRMPLDPRPSEEGSVYVLQEGPRAGRLRVLNATEVVRARRYGVDLYLSHFESCPNATAHRGIPRNQLALEL